MPFVSFVFYGSLRDSEHQKAILGKLPVRIVNGFIRGDFYVVTDMTDPYGIYRYPLVTLRENGEYIASILATFEFYETEKDEILDRLQEYEGSRYVLEEAVFHGESGEHLRGLIFVGRSGITNDSSVKKPAPRKIYDWQEIE